MIEAVRAKSQEQIDKVVEAMLGFGSKKSTHVWAILENGVLVGGASVLKVNGINYFDLAYKLKPSVSLGKAMSIILGEALEDFGQLTARVPLHNKKSRKMARQLGFRLLSTEDNIETLLLDKTTWRYKKRWEI